MDFSAWSKEDLIKVINMHAQNWLAHDGCWFLAAEERFGLETAIEVDVASWIRFTVIEAKRIMKAFAIEPSGGFDALEKALALRLYATVNESELIREEGKIIYKMVTCRVQAAREKKNLDFFPCKQVGIVEYGKFASTIDSRLKTKCVCCPPDPVLDAHCIWEFTLEE